MRFILLGINVAILVLLAIYLFDLFGIRGQGMEVLSFLFLSATISLFITNEFIESYDVKNPLVFLFPSIIVMVSPFIVGKFAAVFILAWILAIPSFVFLIRSVLKKE